jgi:hypothetical protein
MEDDVIYRVRPHILRRVVDSETELVGTTHVDGKEVLLVPVTEEAAKECVAIEAYSGFATEPTTAN